VNPSCLVGTRGSFDGWLQVRHVSLVANWLSSPIEGVV
jgi:hypothetical protein